PNRLFQHHQYQVIIKPSPPDIQQLYLSSLRSLGIKVEEHDIRFVEDDWESPTLGAFGMGWEVRLDSMEITQFTYFQKVGGIDLDAIPVELTYGLERLCMLIQGTETVFQIEWAPGVTYGELYLEDEKEFSAYSFDEADTKLHTELFGKFEKEAQRLLKKGLVKPAHGFVLKCSHTFNILDARRTVSSKQRQEYIDRIRRLAEGCAQIYLKKRKKMAVDSV
ncbi:MAG TPA: glycine--tRNA ligase subunit alpha, partial [Candidatus Omnitrophica bacterium]|nr:glycine--tRNA ligase subunit alpha [Candidatus Omnitrophota bacterium]